MCKPSPDTSTSSAEPRPHAAGEFVFVALGSNLGDRAAYLAGARRALAGLPGTRVVAASSIDETQAIGPGHQPSYLNQMVLLETELSPRELLVACQAIEDAAGRVRRGRWQPRTLDLDLVQYGERRIADRDLHIPHPELPNRPFWQREMKELRERIDER